MLSQDASEADKAKKEQRGRWIPAYHEYSSLSKPVKQVSDSPKQTHR